MDTPMHSRFGRGIARHSFPHSPFDGGGGRRGRGGPHGPRGGGHGPRGRRGRARRGDVRLAALLLIAEEPRNGYQIIQELAARTDGCWKPSPGAIYPALNQLEDEGLIRPSEADSGKAFEITDDGRAEAERIDKAPWEQDERTDHPTADLTDAYQQTWHAVTAVAQTGDESTIAQATAEITELRRRLFQLLAEQGA